MIPLDGSALKGLAAKKLPIKYALDLCLKGKDIAEGFLGLRLVPYVARRVEFFDRSFLIALWLLLLVLGTIYFVPPTWYIVLGTWYTVLGMSCFSKKPS